MVAAIVPFHQSLGAPETHFRVEPRDHGRIIGAKANETPIRSTDFAGHFSQRTAGDAELSAFSRIFNFVFDALVQNPFPERFFDALNIVSAMRFGDFAPVRFNFLGPEYIFLILVPGPIFGLFSLWPLYSQYRDQHIQE